MNSRPHTDTFNRSCRHWSEDGRAGMEAFYRLASLDYQLLAEELDWIKVFQELSRRCGSELGLLDVACGSGQFPAALLKDGGVENCQDLAINYSLLDPSEFSIRTARQRLAAPFVPSEEYHCTIQDFKTTADQYHVVWATHALYCVPKCDLELAVEQMLKGLGSAGIGFIAHASQQSHYIQFHDHYLQSLQSDEASPFSTGEQLIEVLQARLDPTTLRYWPIDYVGSLELEDRDTAERYLQRCLFDDTISLDEMLADRRMGDHLRNCVDKNTGTWRFPQRTWLIFFGEWAESINGFRRH